MDQALIDIKQQVTDYYEKQYQARIMLINRFIESVADEYEQLISYVVSYGYTMDEITFDPANPDLNEFKMSLKRGDEDFPLYMKFAVSKAKKHEGKLYMSFSKFRKNYKLHGRQYTNAVISTPFIQLFADDDKDKRDIFFSIMNALSDIKTDDDAKAYVNKTCPLIKHNLQTLKILDKAL